MLGRRARALVAVGALALVATACDSATTIGEVRNRTEPIDRDGAASAVLGGKVVWVFGDTFTPSGANTSCIRARNHARKRCGLAGFPEPLAPSWGCSG